MGKKQTVEILNSGNYAYNEASIDYDDPNVCYNNSINGMKPSAGVLKK